jgi:hypothetical protein
LEGDHEDHDGRRRRKRRLGQYKQPPAKASGGGLLIAGYEYERRLNALAGLAKGDKVAPQLVVLSDRSPAGVAGLQMVVETLTVRRAQITRNALCQQFVRFGAVHDSIHGSPTLPSDSRLPCAGCF